MKPIGISKCFDLIVYVKNLVISSNVLKDMSRNTVPTAKHYKEVAEIVSHANIIASRLG